MLILCIPWGYCEEVRSRLHAVCKTLNIVLEVQFDVSLVSSINLNLNYYYEVYIDWGPRVR